MQPLYSVRQEYLLEIDLSKVTGQMNGSAVRYAEHHKNSWILILTRTYKESEACFEVNVTTATGVDHIGNWQQMAARKACRPTLTTAIVVDNYSYNSTHSIVRYILA